MLAIVLGISQIISLLQGDATRSYQQPPSQRVDELFVFFKDGHNGYINGRGEIVIQPQFEGWERDFAEGRAVFGVSPTPWDIDHTKFGYIDERGQVVVPVKFDKAEDFSEGLAAVAFNDGKKSKHEFEMPRRWGFIDKNGKIVIAPQFRRARSFSGGLAAVQNLQYKWGYIDPSGKIIVPFQFEVAASFSEGKAAVSTGEKAGFIDQTGTLVIPAQFREARSFSEGMARVEITSFSEGMLRVEIEGGCFTDGRMAPHQYDCGSGKFGYIDHSGHIVFGIDAVNVEDFSEDLAAFQIENQNANPYAPRPSVITGRTGYIWCGYLDKAGKVAIPPRYQSCGPFKEGLANVFLDGSWLYVDSTGKTVLSAPYYWVAPFRHGFALIRDNKNGDGYIDKSGKLIVPTSTAAR